MQGESPAGKGVPAQSTPKRSGADLDFVATMSVREQVDALAQALLREFMHRRGYTRTMQAFDRECPRDERTIASRQLMRQLLELPSNAFPSRLGKSPTPAPVSKGNAKKPTPSTFMEELCSYRLQKREITQRNSSSSCTEPQQDPSDAEMDEWRDAAGKRSAEVDAAAQRIAAAKAKHESTLQAKREKKARLKAERHEKKLRRGGDLGPSFAQAQSFLTECDERRAARTPAPGGCTVGSAWTPFGATVAEFGLRHSGTAPALSPPTPAPGDDAAPSRRPEFFAGEGMALMGERPVRAGPVDEWRPPAPRREAAAAPLGRARAGPLGGAPRESRLAAGRTAAGPRGRHSSGAPGPGLARAEEEEGHAGAGGILLQSRGYDGSARPLGSAMRQGSGFENGGKKEKLAERKERKERKVTILAD